MPMNIVVPTLGESITEATVGQWFKKPGEAVNADEALVELETDKVTLEVNAPFAGVLSAISVQPGETVAVGAILGAIDESGAAAPAANGQSQKTAAPAPAKAAPAKAEATRPAQNETLSPAVRKLVSEKKLDPAAVQGTGKGGQILKGDVLSAGANAAEALERIPAPPPAPASIRVPSVPGDERQEERVRMTKLRQTIARRLKEAQNTAAMLTTFNEVDMSAIMETRNQYKDLFEKKHHVKLGFMGFFVKACVQALKEIPSVNAEIDGTDIIYKNYYHVGVAVGTERGLVVPVIRDAERMGLAEIEKTITDFGRRARDGKLSIQEMQGGTFTISNGGIYGSLMSTPILNAPQSGILGMHRIEERAVVRDGQIVARPMMYLALSYDHRLVDGKDAVTFLVHIKESLEDPKRLVLDL